jgi:DNA-binding protein
MANKKFLSLSGMEKLMKASGAHRVSEDAKEALREVLEDIGRKISKDADELSRHAGRRTVKAEDVRLAVKGK